MDEKNSNQCTHECSTCSGGCSEIEIQPGEKLELVTGAQVKRVVFVSGAKGGVGRSLITCALAGELSRAGLSVGILDADAEGASVAHYLGLNELCQDTEQYYIPVRTSGGIQVISTELALEKGHNPLAWRGEMAANAILAFWSAVLWDKIDILLIDMPSGVSDTAIALMQVLPADGVLLLTRPDILSVSLAARSGGAAMSSGVPVLGIIENMAAEEPSEPVSTALGNLCHAFRTDGMIYVPYNSEWISMADSGKAENISCEQLVSAARLLKEELF